MILPEFPAKRAMVAVISKTMVSDLFIATIIKSVPKWFGEQKVTLFKEYAKCPINFQFSMRITSNSAG